MLTIVNESVCGLLLFVGYQPESFIKYLDNHYYKYLMIQFLLSCQKLNIEPPVVHYQTEITYQSNVMYAFIIINVCLHGCPYLPTLPSLPTLVPSLVLKEVLYMYIEGWYKFNPYLPSLVVLRYVQSINTISLVLRNPKQICIFEHYVSVLFFKIK